MPHTPDVKTLRLILLALTTATIAGAQTYAIRLSRPVPAGQSFAFTARTSIHHDMSRAASVFISGEYEVNFQGLAEVLEIDGKKAPIKIAFTVERFTTAQTMVQNGTTVDLLQPGSVIIADERAQQPISLKGGTMDENVRKAFLLVHSVHKEGDATDDDIFGTNERKAIGDSWPINRARALDSLKDEGITVPPGHLSGTVTLSGKDKFAGLDCLNLQAELAADGILSTDLPPDFTAKVQATFHGCFPIEESGLSYKEQTQFTLQFHVTTEPGEAFEITNTQKSESVWIAKRN